MLVNKKVINRDKFYLFVFPDEPDVERAKKKFNIATFKTENPAPEDVEQFFGNVHPERMPEEVCEVGSIETSTSPDEITVLRGEIQTQLTGISNEMAKLSDRLRVLEALRGN